MKRCCVVFQGRYYSEISNIESIHQTKKQAEKYCRSEGFRFNKSQGLFLNEDKQHYRYLELHNIILKKETK